MRDYQERTGRKTISGTKKLLGVTRAKGILLYSPVLKCHGLKVTRIYRYLKYEAGRPFSWFPKEVSQVRQDGNNNPAFKQLEDTLKLKGNSFYGKMIEDLMKHLMTIFATNEELVDESFRSSFF